MQILKLAIVLIIALIAGIFGGSHLSTYIEHLQPKVPPTVPEYHAPNIIEHVKFLVLSDEIAMTDLERLTLENTFREKNLDFKIIISKHKDQETIQSVGLEENANIVGLATPEKLVSLSQNAPYLLPKFSISFDKSNDCFKEAQLSINSGSDISQIESINQKAVGIENDILPVAKLELLSLKLKNIFPRKIIIYSKRKNGLEDLLHNRIDFYFSKTKLSSSGYMEEGLGNVIDHVFVNYPGLKTIKTTEYKIPCNFIFINSNNRPELISQIEGKLQKMVLIEKPKEMKEFFSIGALKVVSIETWEQVKTLLLRSLNTELSQLSEDVSSN